MLLAAETQIVRRVNRISFRIPIVLDFGKPQKTNILQMYVCICMYVSCEGLLSALVKRQSFTQKYML
jgi:hypothetical protein